MMLSLFVLAAVVTSVWAGIDSAARRITINGAPYNGLNAGPIWTLVCMLGPAWLFAFPYYLVVRARAPQGNPGGVARCPQCNAPIPGVHRFCTLCGAPRPPIVSTARAVVGDDRQRLANLGLWGASGVLMLGMLWVALIVPDFSLPMPRQHVPHGPLSPPAAKNRMASSGGSAGTVRYLSTPAGPPQRVLPLQAPEGAPAPADPRRPHDPHMADFVTSNLRVATEDGVPWATGEVWNNTLHNWKSVTVKVEFTLMNGQVVEGQDVLTYLASGEVKSFHVRWPPAVRSWVVKDVSPPVVFVPYPG